MNQIDKQIKAWADSLAGLGVDVLLDRGLIKSDGFEEAVAVVSEEIYIRLVMGDRPPLVAERK